MYFKVITHYLDTCLAKGLWENRDGTVNLAFGTIVTVPRIMPLRLELLYHKSSLLDKRYGTVNLASGTRVTVL